MENKNLPIRMQSISQYRSCETFKTIALLSLEDNRFNYPQEAILHWVQRLKETFPKEEDGFISKAIKDGMCGKYGEMYHLNLNTVFRWVTEAQKTKRKAFGE